MKARNIIDKVSVWAMANMALVAVAVAVLLAFIAGALLF